MEMELGLIVLLFMLSAVYVVYSRTRRMPPSPPGWRPVIGHLHLMTDMPHMALAEMAKSMRAPLLHLRLGSVDAVVISKPDLAQAAFTTHDTALASRPHLLAGEILSLGCTDVTLSPAGPYHRMVRGVVVSELLSAQRVATYGSVRSNEVRRLLALLANSCTGASATVDLSRCFRDMANDVLCRVVFGRRFPRGKGDKLAALFTEAQNLSSGFAVGDFFPQLEPLASTVTGLRRRLNRCLVALHEICDEFVNDHVSGKHQRIPGDRDEDFIDVLLRAQKSSTHDDDALRLTHDNIMAIIVDMFMAGTDTTFATLDWVMTELVRHPRILGKVQDEVRRVVGAKGHVEESDLGELRYLRAVIKESFRLHPTAPLLVPRESVAPFSLGGYDIPAKTRVFINTFAMGRDPEIWENALQFLPERFDTAGDSVSLTDHHDYMLLPFGGGRRQCPGYRFALATIQVALASLLFHFNWALPAGVRAEDVSLEEVFGLATTKKKSLLVTVTKNGEYEFKGAELDEI